LFGGLNKTKGGDPKKSGVEGKNEKAGKNKPAQVQKEGVRTRGNAGGHTWRP